MAERILELVFRHKVLLALPIVFGLIGGVFALSLADAPYYRSYAAIWVERPTDLSGASFTDFNPWASPAQNQASSMKELLGLDAFATKIIARARPNTTDPWALLELRSNTYIYPGGSHVLYVDHRSQDPYLAQRMVTATIDEYTNLYTSQIRERAQKAKMFYEEQLNAARNQLELTTGELRAYVARNPQLAGVPLDRPPSSALRDAEFARLVAADETARGNYDQLLQKFADSQISANTVDGTVPNFLVMDEPKLPTVAIQPGKRALLMPPMFGLTGGFLISATGFLIYMRLDRRIHLANDLSFIDPSVPVMTLPRAKSRRRNWPSKFVRVGTALQNGLRQTAPAGAGE